MSDNPIIKNEADPVDIDPFKMAAGGTLIWVIAAIALTITWYLGKTPLMHVWIALAAIIVGLAGATWGLKLRKHPPKTRNGAGNN